MSDVLIRDVPGDDLDLIRSAAAVMGVSLQVYLRGTVQAQATHLRRQQALAAVEQRLGGRPAVAEEDGAAVLDAVAADHDARGGDLVQRDGSPVT